MAPLPEDSTARLYLDYTAVGDEHTVQVRYATLAEATAAAAIWQALLEANPAAFGSNVTFTGARASAPGTNVSNPVPFDPVTFVGTAVAANQAPRFLSWAGRTTGGRRVRYYFYGFNIDNAVPNDFRLSGEENAVYAAFQDDLFSLLDETNAVAIDGLTPVMYNYANVGFNAYWQQEARG